MKKVKNGAGKLVCKYDADEKLVEIAHKGFKTVIRFLPDGTVDIKNTHVA